MNNLEGKKIWNKIWRFQNLRSSLAMCDIILSFIRKIRIFKKILKKWTFLVWSILGPWSKSAKPISARYQVSVPLEGVDS